MLSIDLHSIFISNGVGIALLLILYYVSRTRFSRGRTEDRVFPFLVLGVMLGCVMETVSFVLDGKSFPGARFLNYAANTYIFSVNILLIFFLLVYADLCLYGDPDRIRKRYKPQIVIGIVMVAANIVNYFVPITYLITEQNVYVRMPFSYAYYAVIVYYCLTIIFLLRRYEKERGARAFLNFTLFLAPVIVGCGLQFLFYGLSLAWLSSAVGLTGLFMMQQNEMAYIDSLVNTYNRQYMDHLLAAWIGRNQPFAGIMLDVDSFKEINDRCGHTEGDRVLRDLTEILKQSCGDGEWVFRFAGDEFVVLKLTRSPEELQSYMDEVNRRIAGYNEEERPFRLSVSYGISACAGGDTDTFLKDADEKMYQMKAAHHREN